MDRRALALWIALATYTGCSLSLAASGQGPADQMTVTRSGEGFEHERGEDELRDSNAFSESVAVDDAKQRGTVKGSTSTTLSSTSLDAWIYDASTELFDDYDGDGYYHYVRVRFDADSIFGDHWVFARLYSSSDGHFWDEYHVTEDFLIHGTSAFDDFEVETELVSGFPTGLYDILIELYDADTGIYLAEYGPVESSAFSLLPLEDTHFDAVEPTITFSTEHGGGGSLDWMVIGALSLLLLVRQRRIVKAGTLAPHSTDRTPSAPVARPADCR